MFFSSGLSTLRLSHQYFLPIRIHMMIWYSTDIDMAIEATATAGTAFISLRDDAPRMGMLLKA